MLIFNSNQLNSLQEIFVTVLILHPTLIFLAFRAYLLEPPPQDYITKGKTIKKSQNSNEVKMVVLILGYALREATAINFLSLTSLFILISDQTGL